MKKLLMSAAMAAMFGAMIPAANAAVGTNSFNVTATLSSACTVGAIADLAFGTVTAFVAPIGPFTTTAVVTCTRNLTGITADFDTVAGVTTGNGGLAANPIGAGLLTNGLRYALSTAGGGTASAGTAATTASIGTGGTFTYTITGTMAAQAGTCAGASCAATPQVRTLTLNY